VAAGKAVTITTHLLYRVAKPTITNVFLHYDGEFPYKFSRYPHNPSKNLRGLERFPYRNKTRMEMYHKVKYLPPFLEPSIVNCSKGNIGLE
jgi:hypothetical protein